MTVTEARALPTSTLVIALAQLVVAAEHGMASPDAYHKRVSEIVTLSEELDRRVPVPQRTP